MPTPGPKPEGEIPRRRTRRDSRNTKAPRKTRAPRARDSSEDPRDDERAGLGDSGAPKDSTDSPAAEAGSDHGPDSLVDPWPSFEWNPFIGCKPRGPECLNCYAAMRVWDDLGGESAYVSIVNGRPTFSGHVSFLPPYLELPLSLKVPAVIFFASLFDPFHPSIGFHQISPCLDLMKAAHWHEFNVLTKYEERALEVCERYGELPMNLRMGISAGTQEGLSRRWEFLRRIPAVRYILSIEPILEAIEIPEDFDRGWVVAMREVGPDPRPARPEWFRSLRDQCRNRPKPVPFFWETTGLDGRDLCEERAERRRLGDPYKTQPHTIGLPVTTISDRTKRKRGIL